ncbi:hypothetical protein NKG05_19820 [Oerskovia sp. M15]
MIATTDGASAHPGSPARVTNDTDEWVEWIVERLGDETSLATDEGGAPTATPWKSCPGNARPSRSSRGCPGIPPAPTSDPAAAR